MFLKTDVADTRNKIEGQGDDLKHGVGAERGCSEFFINCRPTGIE